MRAAILAVLLGLFIRTFLVETVEIESASMAPSLLPGDHVLVNRLLYTGADMPFLPLRPVGRGDVVVFERPGGDLLVKRVVALPGEVLEIVGEVRVDGSARPALGRVPREPSIGPLRLRSREIYVLGDNRPRSRDSRHWGPARKDWLRGRALLVYWSTRPSGPEGWDKMTSSAWLKIRSTRWNRWLVPVR